MTADTDAREGVGAVDTLDLSDKNAGRFQGIIGVFCTLGQPGMDVAKRAEPARLDRQDTVGGAHQLVQLARVDMGGVGERVIAYLDLIGRIEGTILSLIDGGFVMDLVASPRKRDKMAAQLTWLANKDVLDLPEDRRHERVVPDIRHSTVVLDDGRRYNCKIIDISLSGAAIELDVRPASGTNITLGRMRARVARHFQNGVAVEFISAQEMLTVVQQNLRMN